MKRKAGCSEADRGGYAAELMVMFGKRLFFSTFKINIHQCTRVHPTRLPHSLFFYPCFSHQCQQFFLLVATPLVAWRSSIIRLSRKSATCTPSFVPNQQNMQQAGPKHAAVDVELDVAAVTGAGDDQGAGQIVVFTFLLPDLPPVMQVGVESRGGEQNQVADGQQGG